MHLHTGAHRWLCAAILGVSALVYQGCTTVPEETSLLRTELFFGMNKPDGDTVTTAEWQAFVDTCVTRVFPAGCTIADAAGWWQNEAGTTERERTKILILIHARDDGSDQRVEYVRTAYKTAFRQTSVLRVTLPVHASF